MSRIDRFRAVVLSLFLVVAAARPARAETLAVDDFLAQVSRSNGAYQSLQMDSSGALLSAESAKLLFRPQAFTNAQYVYDTRDTHAPSLEGTRNIQRNLSLGVRQQTPFGLQFQLSLDYNQSSLEGADSPLVTRPSLTNLYPVPTFNFSLWQNFLGRGDRANQRLMEAQALAKAHGNAFAARAALVEAEGLYWKLAILRMAIRLQKASVSRAKELHAFQSAKKRQRLLDPTDALLGEAAVQGKELELKSMQAEERAAARAFNAARGVDSDVVPEELPLQETASLLALRAPERKGRRGDLRAAEQMALAAAAGHEIARDKLLPSLNVYGSIFAFGVSLSVPLDQGSARDAREGFARQRDAAEMGYQRKVFEEESSWKDLQVRFADLQERLRLALKLEDIQKRKFEEVRRRRERGLTVAFQVFQYELDYLSAAQARLQLEGGLLGLRAQLKLYEGES